VRTGVPDVVTQPTLACLSDGAELLMRAAVDGDLRELQAMHARCSGTTLAARYLGDGRPPSRRLCRELLRTDVAIAAFSPTGSLIALGNLAGSDEDPQVAEVAVVVEDAWQRGGLGTVMLRHLVAAARLLGYEEVVAIAPTRGSWTEASLARLGAPLLQHTPFGEAVVRLSLAPHHAGLLARPAPASRRVVVTRAGVASGR